MARRPEAAPAIHDSPNLTRIGGVIELEWMKLRSTRFAVTAAVEKSRSMAYIELLTVPELLVKFEMVFREMLVTAVVLVVVMAIPPPTTSAAPLALPFRLRIVLPLIETAAVAV